MKPLAEMTEADLQAASDEELNTFLLEAFGYRISIAGWYLSGKGMLEVLEAMKEWEFDVVFPRKDRSYFARFEQTVYPFACGIAYHASLPRAVAVASLLAMKERGKT